jgi:3-hydroxybutyryl-CoA dehydratase
MFEVGYIEREIFSYTQDDVIKFSEITGDNNPIHLDSEYAKDTIFKKPIVHGMLGASIFSKMLGTGLYGQGTIYLKQDFKFIRPMYVDTNYEAEVKIVDVDKEKHRVVVKTSVYDRNSNLIIKGEGLIQNDKIN